MYNSKRMDRALNIKFNKEKINSAFKILDSEVENNLIPSAVTIIGYQGKIVGSHTTGSIATNEKVKIDTIFDCASLTKVVVTLPLILKVIEKGLLDINDLVGRYIPSFKKGKKAKITIQQLMTHTSGLKPLVNEGINTLTPEEIKNYMYSQGLICEPGSRVIYSDIGYIILGDIISIILGEELDKLAHKFIFKPLNMKSSYFCPEKSLIKRIAPTEFQEDLNRHKKGEVHDEQAYALGGVAGHAGLFSTADDLFRYSLMWLREGKIQNDTFLSIPTIKATLRNYTEKLNGDRGLGWVLKGDSLDDSGGLFSPDSYGHTGFTGTSLWVDPINSITVVLLTNRIYFGRKKTISHLRRRFHNIIASSIM